MSKSLFIDFHVIQTVPPSCINRDDTGSPKTAVYGGTLRARVSSQAWKKAMRDRFKELFTSEMLGYRTRKINSLIIEKICAENPDFATDAAEKVTSEILGLAGIKADAEKKDVLFFVSGLQVETLARLAVEYRSDKTGKKEKEKIYKKRVENALKENPSVDILLFGRMAANNPSLNYDAAAQVAHSISTHTISNEYDYFTAVDDCTEDTGAGHIGTVEFNASTLYRYATVNVTELSCNLKADELKLAVKGFADAFIRSMPTGRQNTFANRTLPNIIYVTFREDQPINLASAFEKPVFAGGGGGYVEKSGKELVSEAQRIYRDYSAAPLKAWIVGDAEEGFADKVTFAELLEEIAVGIDQYCAEGK